MLLSGDPLQNKHRKKAKSGYQGPFEQHKAITLETDLRSASVKHERHHCTQQHQENKPAKNQHGYQARANVAKPWGARFSSSNVTIS